MQLYRLRVYPWRDKIVAKVEVRHQFFDQEDIEAIKKMEFEAKKVVVGRYTYTVELDYDVDVDAETIRRDISEIVDYLESKYGKVIERVQEIRNELGLVERRKYCPLIRDYCVDACPFYDWQWDRCCFTLEGE